MKDIFTKKEVVAFIDAVEDGLLNRTAEEWRETDSYLDDPSDKGLKCYWYHRGKAMGLEEAIGILTGIAIERYSGGKE